MSIQPATTPLIRRVPPAGQNTRIGAHDSGTVAGPRIAAAPGAFSVTFAITQRDASIGVAAMPTDRQLGTV
jgi:hypothetical protein